MDTAYSIILNLGENELKYLRCDLAAKQIWFKQKLIFINGSFQNITNADVLNGMPLIDKISSEGFESDLVSLYQQYLTAYPSRCKFLNFVPADKQNFNYFNDAGRFHSKRLALELYIIFHTYLKHVHWKYDDSYFMHRVSDGLILYKKWF